MEQRIIKFKKVNPFYDINDGIVVIDVNLQGASTIDYPAFKERYPKAYSLYMNHCRNNYSTKVGDVLIVEELDGRKICVCFTQKNRIEKQDVIMENFKKCLGRLLTIVPSDVFLYSPILGRRQNNSMPFYQTIRSVLSKTNDAPRNWYVCNLRD